MKSSRLLVGLAASTVAIISFAAPPSSAAPRTGSVSVAGAEKIVKVDAAQLASMQQDKTADALVAKLGKSSAGVYYAKGELSAAVTTKAALKVARQAGAKARLVKNSTAQLSSAMTTLDATAKVPGTSWAIEPASNKVVVQVDSSVQGAQLAKVQAAVAALGSKARIERVAGTFSTRINGGSAIYGGGYRCSLGFNVRSGSTYYFLTAGHCGEVASNWYSNSGQTTLLGPTIDYSFPGDDFALVKYTGSATHEGTVNLYNGSSQDITSAGTPTVGQTVYRSGSTTKVHSGTVRALNATVNYGDGTSVYGTIRTNVCAEGGDSGGSLYSGTVAYGLTSGGSGNCSVGGTTYFQPVTEALSVYGVNVY